jgi:uncharacterized protein DUF3306
MTEEKEAFLDRWSRLKREQPEEKPVLPEARQEPAPSLPRVEDLKADSDFSPFMHPKVDDATRRSALKKLFTDPHFNLPDLYEPYSADFTKSEPIPELMLAAINKVRDLAISGPGEGKTEESGAAAKDPEAKPQEPDEPAGKQDA